MTMSRQEKIDYRAGFLYAYYGDGEYAPTTIEWRRGYVAGTSARIEDSFEPEPEGMMNDPYAEPYAVFDDYYSGSGESYGDSSYDDYLNR